MDKVLVRRKDIEEIIQDLWVDTYRWAPVLAVAVRRVMSYDTGTPSLYWHFSTGTNGYGDGREIVVGRWQRMKKHPVHGLTPVLCAAGMHASRRAIDALDSRRGPIVSICELRGEVQHGVGKSVGRWRRVIAQADATEVLHRFAIWCAARALRQCEVTAPACWHALRVKSRWLVGRATDGELEEASEAVDADTDYSFFDARDSAYSATYAEACEAAAHAAYDATDAAYSAADTAYDGSVGAYAYVDERKRQNAYLESRLLKLLGRR